MFETNKGIHWVGRLFVVQVLAHFGEVIPHLAKVVVAHKWAQKRDSVVQNMVGTSGDEMREGREGTPR